MIKAALTFSSMNDIESKFPRITLSGSAREIGEQHGSLLRDRINDCWDFYRSIIPGKDSELRELSEDFAKVISNYDTSYAEEIEGISHASNIPLWKIYALNCRTELIRQLNRIHAPKECTAICFRESSILGQTWDWAEELEKLVVIAEIEKHESPRILMLTEPGIIGKIGFNSRGIGVTLNILRCQEPIEGVPIHILLRAVLESKSLEAATALFQDQALGSMSNLIIADAENACINQEIAGKNLASFGQNDPFVLHTNHYLQVDVGNEKPDFESSYTRFGRAQQLLLQLFGTKGQADVAAMKRILLDSENGHYGISHTYNPDDVIRSEGTVCALVMDLKNLTMHITPGNPLHNDFIEHSL
jgi:isopenicillin-N N-acyltransferase-like protein